MKVLDWNSLDAASQAAALARPPQRAAPALVAEVRRIVDDVRARGWDALCEHATRIDGAAPRRVPVAPAAEAARARLTGAEQEAIRLAARNIEIFHRAAVPAETTVETVPGLTVRKVWRPLRRAGLYVPGGLTPLFSTLLMLALPARAAGVEELVVVTPPRPDGSLDPVVAFAAELCGVEAVWTVGGAQAVAALAFGAGDIPRVDKICGPGNAWVSEAKTYVAGLPGGTAIDMPAGPSELMVIADDTADAETVAADLLSQAEHDASAQVLLVTPSAALARRVAERAQARACALPRREIARASLAHARALVVRDLDQALAVADDYAPEHLSLAVADAGPPAERVRNAGAVFAGHGAAESFGDYLAGSSHVLPTDGAARAWSGVSVHTFLKAVSIQTITPDAARRLAAPAALLARLEGLEAHALAAEARA
ncbi:MAG TPA: histidinol dehydrogenase [Caulobacteraceae bacterium]|nr:histidinol dehydrogenase [Caulobacteraceae bacterium]